ncbi:unnamed protein product [Heterobilharzia americana]|nr:unnamed protein product [Heterobilharzia americana]
MKSKLPQFHLYACHDSSLMLLLFGLNVFDGCWPPFAADLIFELYTTKTSSSSSSCCQSTSSHLRPGDNSLTLVDYKNSEKLNNLWFRLLYLGKPIPLKSLWKLSSYSNGYDMLDNDTLSSSSSSSLVPLKVLYEKLEEAKTLKH